MKKDATTRPVSPLAGTERAWFEGKKESLRADDQLHAQGIVDVWELSSPGVTALKKKRFREVRLITFFGTITLLCREGVNAGGHRRLVFRQRRYRAFDGHASGYGGAGCPAERGVRRGRWSAGHAHHHGGRLERSPSWGELGSAQEEPTTTQRIHWHESAQG